MDEASVTARWTGSESRNAGPPVATSAPPQISAARTPMASPHATTVRQVSEIPDRSTLASPDYVMVATTLVMSGDRPTNGTFTRSTCLPPTVTTVWSCQAATDLHDPP